MLQSPSAYDHPVETIEIRETHVSWVFLTGSFAYKIKKPVKFGDILDFSTLDLRKKFCQEELELNSRFSADIYLNTFSINSEGKINGPGKPIEYGVLMKQLPEKYLMSSLLSKKGVTESAVNQIARTLAVFHEKTEKVPEWGEMKYIAEKWDENFRTTSQFRKVNEKFQQQIEGCITDNHGDLQSHNIFILPDENIRIFDCIEFNPLLRYGDLAEDVGFLAMDLDYWGEQNLASIFVESYIKHSGDELLEEVIDFFKCYRAYVRGKVYGFQASNETNEIERKNQIEISNRYYELAESYIPKFIS
jgi:aminoglycoside phosphotransferase family enzyme